MGWWKASKRAQGVALGSLLKFQRLSGGTFAFILTAIALSAGASTPVQAQIQTQVQAPSNGQPDLEVTYSYWLNGQKAADLTTAFSVLRASETGLETIVVKQTYWAHGLPGVPIGRTEVTAIAHHDPNHDPSQGDAGGGTGAIRTLAYTLDYAYLGGGQVSVQRVGGKLQATGVTLPFEALPEAVQDRAANAMDPYSAAVATLFRVAPGRCPGQGDMLLPDGLIALEVRKLSDGRCHVRERAIALVDGADFVAADSYMDMAQVEDFWLPVSGTYKRGDVELTIWLDSVRRGGEEISQIAQR